MAETERTVRQSVSIPAGIAKRVRTLARTRKTSANRVLVDLIEADLQSKEAEKERFFSLVSRLTETSDAAERQRLKRRACADDLRQLMPKIRWTDLPADLRQHLFDRVADRQISAEDLYKLKLWRESEPEAPAA
jgi:hypothetical protein